MADPTSGIPWNFVREAAVLVFSALAAIISGLGALVIKSFRDDLTTLAAEVETLKADRSSLAVMAEQIKNLGREFAQYRDAMEAHHLENRNTAAADREETAKWRTEVMGPVIQKLVTDVELSKERILVLQKQRGKRS